MSTGPDAVPGEITMLLDEARAGRPGALDDLFALVYDELREMARACFADAANRHDLNGTALVHAACERLLGAGAAETRSEDGASQLGDAATDEKACGRVMAAENRKHFFFLFDRAMHDALVKQARMDAAQKRGGDRQRVPMLEFEADGSRFTADILDLRDALEELRLRDADASQIIMLRFFGGRSLVEASELMGCTLAAGREHWEYAKAWLYERLSRGGRAE